MSTSGRASLPSTHLPGHASDADALVALHERRDVDLDRERHFAEEREKLGGVTAGAGDGARAARRTPQLRPVSAASAAIAAR